MNLAFPALCILFMVLPGIIFRNAYTKGAVPVFFPPGYGGLDGVNKFPTSNRPLAEEIGASLVAAIILHIIWLTLCPFLLGGLKWMGWATAMHPLTTADYMNLFRVLYGDLKANGAHDDAMRFLAESRHGLVFYFLSLYSASFMFGRWSIRLIRRFKLDHRLIQFRLADQWFYFLRGEMFSFIEFKQLIQDKPPHVTGTYVSVVVDQGDGDYLYKGFLWDFHLDSKGDLDRLVLHNVIRCKFDPSSPTVDGKAQEPVESTQIVDVKWQFQRVTSQVFTVKYADCKTLACTYFYIKNLVPKGEG